MYQNTVITRILEYTAWQTGAPELFGAVHIALLALTVCLASVCALKVRNLSFRRRLSVLTICGLLLAALEIYKQLFLYHIVNHGVYDWWYFPFQLCSVPMYLCILLPLHAGRRNSSAYAASMTFMTGFTFISAAAALIYPQDFLRAYTALTIHGFLWHGILLFISLTIALSGMSDLSAPGIFRSAVLFFILCAAAVCINAAAEPAMAILHSSGLVPERFAAMFYLNPYHLSPQPLVGEVQQKTGIPAGLALYAFSVAAAASAADLIFAGWRRRR